MSMNTLLPSKPGTYREVFGYDLLALTGDDQTWTVIGAFHIDNNGIERMAYLLHRDPSKAANDG